MRQRIVAVGFAVLAFPLVSSVARGDDCETLPEAWQKTACRASCGAFPTVAPKCDRSGCSTWNPRAECEATRDKLIELARKMKAEADATAAALAAAIKKGRKAIAVARTRVVDGAKEIIGEILARGSRVAVDALCGPWGNSKLCEFVVQAKGIAEIMSNYRAKRDEARAKRAGPPPIATGYNEARADSPAGRASLAQKANDWETYTARHHFRDSLIVPGLKVRLTQRGIDVFGIWSGMQNSGFNTGVYLAARAFKAGVTRDNADFDAVRSALAGIYNLMTIARAPNNGTLRVIKARPKPGDCTPAPRPTAGVVARSFVRIKDATTASPGLNSSVDFAQASIADAPYGVFEFEGKLLVGFNPPKTARAKATPKYERGTFRFIPNVSRDEIYGIFLGLDAAFDVLSKHRPKDPWVPRIKEVVGDFTRRFVEKGFRLVDLDGCVTSVASEPHEGDQSLMVRPDLLLQNLSWLKVAHRVTGDRLFSDKYNELVQTYRLLGAGESAWLRPLLTSIAGLGLGELKELALYFYQDFNFVYHVLPFFHLMRLEENAALREVYANYFFSVVWTLFGDARVPLFDTVALVAARSLPPARRQEIVAAISKRPAAVLAQVRDRPFPFGANPYNGARATDGLQAKVLNDFADDPSIGAAVRTSLKDPLFTYLRENRHRLSDGLAGTLNDRCRGGAYALGPGLMPNPGLTVTGQPYSVCLSDPGVNGPHVVDDKTERPIGWTAWAGHDFLVSYWMGRYHGFISGPER
ncbi:MAG: hypothetical protein HYY84_12040 [Deltaproteobacteria bacterium]|nr:hypothetical protein [Deltaproteobacteria bacterium]